MTLGRRGFLNGLLATCGSPGTACPDMPRRTIRADVFVAGAGPAGFVAAIAAARRGARVALAESLGFPGGMATAGLVGPIHMNPLGS